MINARLFKNGKFIIWINGFALRTKKVGCFIINNKKLFYKDFYA